MRGFEVVEHALRAEPELAQSLFGDASSPAIAEDVENLLQRHLGQSGEFLFCHAGVGLVFGVAVGSLRVVVKVHVWRASLEGLRAVQRAQRQLCDAGLAVSRPLALAEPFANGVVTLETLLEGEVPDGKSARVRTTLAHELRRFIVVGSSVVDPSTLGGPALLSTAASTLWPTPHSARFDFEATAIDATWIDDLARKARRRLSEHHEEPVVGHMDWRVENVGFRGSDLTAIYDMDSLGTASEAFLVGCAAATFSTNWTRVGGDVPTLAEMHEFVNDYEEARGRSLDRDERETIDAANQLLVAYGARCQVSDSLTTTSTSPSTSWVELLRSRGASGLVSA